MKCSSKQGEERPYFDLLPAAMHLRIQYLGVVALIEASKLKELDTIESSVERLRMKMESPEEAPGRAKRREPIKVKRPRSIWSAS